MEKFSHESPVKPAVLVSFRKRLTAEYLMEVNEYIMEISGFTREHETENESKNALNANTPCQDFSLLNEAREKVEAMIDYFHKTFHPWAKPRNYYSILWRSKK